MNKRLLNSFMLALSVLAISLKAADHDLDWMLIFDFVLAVYWAYQLTDTKE